MFEINSQTMSENTPVKGNAGVLNAVGNRMEDFENFVKIQSDAALRQVAGIYAYDNNEGDCEELTLCSGGGEINEQLVNKLK